MLTDSSVQLQEQNRLLSEKTFVLELSLNEKNQELQEMKDMLEAKSNDLHSALKLIEVSTGGLEPLGAWHLLPFQQQKYIILFLCRSCKKRRPHSTRS